jgi:phage baseplate assembly protein W
MAKEFLGRGWKFPVNINSTGAIEPSEYEEDIEEAIRIILSTPGGERVMRNDFGCAIHDFVFALINTSTIAMIEASVREALAMWEPRIELIEVNISTDKAGEGLLPISIDYRVISTNNEFNMVYPFYLKEGR